MRIRSAWTTHVVLCFGFGTVGLATSPIGATVGWALLAVTVGLIAGHSSGVMRGMRRLTGWTGSAAGLGLAVAAGVLTGCLVISGSVFVFGAPGAAAVACGIGMVTAGWRLLVRRPERPATVPASTSRSPRATELPTAELCLEWRRSYLALQQAPDEAARQRLVQRRQEYLDEIERRDCEGFTRWLSSGARAGSDPQRYLTTDG